MRRGTTATIPHHFVKADVGLAPTDVASQTLRASDATAAARPPRYTRTAYPTRVPQAADGWRWPGRSKTRGQRIGPSRAGTRFMVIDVTSLTGVASGRAGTGV